MKEAKQERQELNWQLAYSRERDGACSDWMPASVPGCVQLDTAAARGDPALLYGRSRGRVPVDGAALLALPGAGAD